MVLFQNINSSCANDEENSLTVFSTFQMTEYCENIGTKENISSINIDMPSSSWNVTEVDLSFDNISLKNETITVEDKFSRLRTLKYVNNDQVSQTLILGQQINITEPTKFFSVYLYGEKDEGASGPVYIQINGWDSTDNKPTNDTYGDHVLLNWTDTAQWISHTFPSPIELSPGYYCLVLNGTNMNDGDEYYWYSNEESFISELYSCRYRYRPQWEEWRWQNYQGEIFLHKFMRWVNRSYFPSDIDMNVTINGISYRISDGKNIGTGNLIEKNLEFSPLETELIIPIINNLSGNIFFNLSYNIKLKNKFFSEGSVSIEKSSYNHWEIFPIINRYYSNYSIKFEYPSNWDNLKIYKNYQDITLEDSSIIRSENIVYILNDIITNDAHWMITAKSPIIDFNLNLPQIEFNPAQDFEISVEAPNMHGTLIFLLINALGDEIYIESKEVNSELTNFSYLIRADAQPGEWEAIIFWNNNTDAGSVSQTFKVSIIPSIISVIDNDDDSTNDNPEDQIVLNPLEIFMISIIIVIVISTSLTSYIVIKRKKSKEETLKQKKLNKYIDIFNLNCLIVIAKKSGLNIFEEFYSGKHINITLVSGFLEAIHHFGIELTDSNDISQTIKLEYNNSKIIMSDFKNFRLILIMHKTPSNEFLDSVKSLSYEIEDNYSQLIKNFKGKLESFKGIKEIIKKHLEISLISPLKIILSKNVNLNQNEKSIINRALSIIKKNNSGYFYVKYLIHEDELDFKTIETILSLIDKKIIQVKI
jgi:hypothetical protein